MHTYYIGYFTIILIVNRSRVTTTTCRDRYGARVADDGTRRHRWCSSLESTSRRFLFLNTDHQPPPLRPPNEGRAYKYWNYCDDVAAAAADDGVVRGAQRVFIARACSRTAVVVLVQRNTVSSVDGPRTRLPNAKHRIAAPSPPTDRLTDSEKILILIYGVEDAVALSRAVAAVSFSSGLRTTRSERVIDWHFAYTNPGKMAVFITMLWLLL